MMLEGVVTNVAAFGAFVDIGVHQDGLVHVSAMSKTFVKDPREVVKPGDVVRVKVLEVDIPRKRISLTLRLDDEVGGDAGPRRRGPRHRRDAPPDTALAAALRRAGLDRPVTSREWPVGAAGCPAAPQACGAVPLRMSPGPPSPGVTGRGLPPPAA